MHYEGKILFLDYPGIFSMIALVAAFNSQNAEMNFVAATEGDAKPKDVAEEALLRLLLQEELTKN
jgi:hypothetical protein